MSKDNLTGEKGKGAAYRELVNPRLMDIMREKIVEVLMMQKKYKDPAFSARRLAEELNTNTRYVSAVMRMRFNMNYASYVNKLRVEEAMLMLADKRYAGVRMDEIAYAVGFSNRQSFYSSFCKFAGMTPRSYKLKNTPLDCGGSAE